MTEKRMLTRNNGLLRNNLYPVSLRHPVDWYIQQKLYGN